MWVLLKKSALIFLCLGLSVGPVFAAIQTTSMLVSVDVMPACIVTATPLVFGFYSPGSRTPTQSISRFRVLCTLNTPYNITLDQGTGASATTRLRTMSGPETEVIHYTLSQNPTHTINWGNTIGVDTLVNRGTGVPQYLIVYGEIPAGQNVSSGAYRDVVNVNIIF